MKTARASRASGSGVEAADHRDLGEQPRALLGDLERARVAQPQPQQSDLAREREDRNREPRAEEQGDHEAEAEPLVGGEVIGRQRRERGEGGGERGVARHRHQPTVERAPKQAQGAPARPRRIAPTIVAAKVAIRAAAR